MLDDLTAPRGWRDVYTLVRDTRADVLNEVGGVRTDLADLTKRFDMHLREADRAGGEQARKRGRMETARVFVQTVLPIPTAILAVIAILSK